MNLKQELLGVSNQEKILQLKEKIKSVDSIYPKSPSHSRNALNLSSSPIEQVVQAQNKQFVRSHNNQYQHLLQLQVHYRQLEETFKNKLQHEYKLLQAIDLEIASIQEEVRLSKKELDRSREYLEQRASNLEKEANLEVLEQVEEIKALRKELTQAIDKKYKTIKTQTMAALGSHFDSGWEEAREDLTSKIDDLKVGIDQEEAARDEAVNYMVNSFGDEIIKLEQEVQKERELRQQNHKKILNELQRMEEDLTTLILLEKKEANTGISHLQNFLEELCLKIQSHLLS